MNIIPLFSQQDINAHIQKQLKIKNKMILEAFAHVGEQCISHSRLNNTYKDQTGNLRGSIAYVVVIDGVIFRESQMGNSQGAQESKRYIRELVSRYNKGIVLIVVAGMKYGRAVEARGLDVITNSELLAKQLVPQILTSLGFKK